MTADEMERVTDWLSSARPEDTLTLTHLAQLMGVPDWGLRDRASESRLLPQSSWPGQDWAWSSTEFRTWYWAGGRWGLATYVRMRGSRASNPDTMVPRS